jgi:pyoverdine/dityrosine biosynthesis protein Dit1
MIRTHLPAELNPIVRFGGNHSEIAKKAARTILANRKVKGEPCKSGTACAHCIEPVRDKVQSTVERGERITMVIPSFPFAMPNPNKKFGRPAPDMSERLSLIHMRNFCREFAEFYPVGAQVVIAADGHVLFPVWNSWFTVTEDDVTHYVRRLREMIDDIGAADEIAIWGLEDAYPDGSIDEKRMQLLHEYPLSVKETEAAIRTPGTPQNLAYVGQASYFTRDGTDSTRKDEVLARYGETQVSNSAVRRVSKKLAIEATHLADAWSHRIVNEFPRALRLSVHPYPVTFTAKLGIHLTAAREMMGTPWHTVAVLNLDKNRWSFVFRHEAEKAGAKLASDEHGNPDHFILAT